jgi:hypothetical protein
MLKLSVAAALIAAPAANPPGAPRCITRAEVGDVTLVGAAILVEGVRSACRTHLPATAFLAGPAGTEFAARMRAEGLRRLEPALAGITRVAGQAPDMNAAMIRTMIRGFMAEGTGTELAPYADPILCRDANEILEIASTLSPDQMARFTGAFASLADRLARMAPPRPPAAPDDLDESDELDEPEADTPRPQPIAFVAPPEAPSPPPVATVTRPARPPLPPFLCPQP